MLSVNNVSLKRRWYSHSVNICVFRVTCQIHDSGWWYIWRCKDTTWWRHQMETFSASLAICAGNSPVSGEFPHKGQWRGVFMFSLICVWINGWVNNGEAGWYETPSCPLWRHRNEFWQAFDTLWSSDALWWHRPRSTLAQVMTCCLTAPSHYLNHCWLPISTIQ